MCLKYVIYASSSATTVFSTFSSALLSSTTRRCIEPKQPAGNYVCAEFETGHSLAKKLWPFYSLEGFAASNERATYWYKRCSEGQELIDINTSYYFERDRM
jgi:hypothetical protein